jgi:HSP20 family protein
MFLLRQGEIHWTPAVDIYESDSSWLVFVELPGLTTDDVDLTVFSESLIIRGIKSPPVRDLLAQKLEIYSGIFYREISLPGKTDVNHVSASMENGVLKIILPIVRDQSVRIPVEDRPSGGTLRS